MPESVPQIDTLLRTARQHHGRGNIAEAERLYRQVLALQPDHADALSLLGAACIGLGRIEESIGHLQRSLANNPQLGPALDNLGVALAKLGRLPEAADAFERATRLQPNFAPTWVNLGNALAKQGKLAEAVGPLQTAIRLNPNLPQPHFELAGVLLKLGQNEAAARHYARCAELQPGNIVANFYLGMSLAAIGRNAEARAAYENADSLKPDHPETLVNLGSVLTSLGKHDEAIVRLRRAIALRPNFAEAHINLGSALTAAGRYDEAVLELRRAAQLNPNSSEAQNNLGNALVKQFDYPAAIAAYRRALQLKPDDPEPRYNLGSTYYRICEPARAIAEVNQALARRPNYSEAQYTRAVSSLLLGDFEQGWADYDARWMCPEFKPRKYTQPLWDGNPLAGKRILLFAEQGLGDTLQFVRFARLVKQMGGHTILEVHKPLLRLLEHVPGIDELRALDSGSKDSGSKDFDVYAPLMSLPGILKLSLDSLPAEVPYLSAPVDRAAHWQTELRKLASPRVGLAWQGNPKYPEDRLRSIPLSQLAPLGTVGGVCFVSLQKGPGAEQIENVREQLPLHELGNDFDEAAGPFVDTAAAMMHLDLVITSDTAVAHLAGALGRPVWVLLPFAPDWRWLLERSDTPWYPTMRLFRQPTQGEWQPVVAEVVTALQEFTASSPAR